MKQDRKICVGMIVGAHGVSGLVRLRSFTEDPEGVAAYGPLADEEGSRSFTLKLNGVMKDHFIVSIKGVGTREAADALRGTKLYVDREALPKTRKREYYEADLVGLEARDGKKISYGMVSAVHSYGGGSFLEIGRTKTDSFMLPFTDAYVPEVDVEEGFIVIELPEGWLEEKKPKTKSLVAKSGKRARA